VPTVKADRAAVLVPGGSRVEGPLLTYAGLAVKRRDGYLHRLEWTGREQVEWPAWPSAAPVFSAELHAWVESVASAAIDKTAAATGTPATAARPPTAGTPAPVVIGKSLASLAASVVTDRALAAVWFTPLLRDEPTVAALRRATAPCLLIGGTADPLWDGPTARSISPHVVEVDGADHGMFVPGPLSASAAVLGHVMTAVELFLDQVVW
jgi:pimeloyl-ACP methyl ester carboxylesterase